MAGEKTFYPGGDNTEIASGPFPALRLPDGPWETIPEAAQLERWFTNNAHGDIVFRYQGLDYSARPSQYKGKKPIR